MFPASIAGKDVDVVHLLPASYKTFQEIAKILRTGEKDRELKDFYAHLAAWCLMIRGHLNRIKNAAIGVSHKLITRLLDQLEAIIRPTVLQNPLCGLQAGARLRTFNQLWDEIQRQNNKDARLEFIRLCLNFGETPEEHNGIIQSLAECEDEFRARYPEDSSQWTEDSVTLQKNIREPTYGVQNAALSIFKALVACKNCSCTPTHEIGARLCLGTYRKPELESNADMDGELDFDMFLSMKQEWHEACVHTAKESVIKWAVDDKSEQPKPKKGSHRNKPMRVKRLCEPIAKIKAMAAYRLEFKVTRDQLFKLQSERSTSLVDKAKDPVSLEQFLKGESRSFTERTKRILAVILSSAVLHLHDTPWLQPTWSSANVLFFPTASSAVPLRPFIQSPLSDLDTQHDAEHHTSLEDNPDHYDVGENDSVMSSDDLDPDDLMGHQCPILVTLAVMLMEVYFITPFDVLAKKYDVDLGEDMESSRRTRFLDTDLVFKACRGEIPENSQFHYAVEKCLDPTTWEDEEGNKLDNETLRTRIYHEVVRPLETELVQAFSSISIDDLDRYAQTLNFASWDQTIQTWNQQAPAEVFQGHPLDSGQTCSPSPKPASPYYPQYFPALQRHLQYPDPSDWGHHLVTLHQVVPTTDHRQTNDICYKSSRFFDDETLSEIHSSEARLGYKAWKSKYLDVYNKFITQQLAGSCSSSVKIAILDTGIDLTHPDVEARADNIKGKYNWLNRKFQNVVPDRNGHGTFTACLLLDYAPDVELYIAKIADNKPSSPKLIAEAINYAVSTWKVDIISMSFGFPTCNIEGYADLESALVNAYASHVLLFAAASNSGAKLGRSFPAREPTVIAVHATDVNGNRSGFSPTAATDNLNIATVGEAVESAWPVHLCDEVENPEYVKYKSGTSFATPIAAGIAAFLLLYARVHMPDIANALKDQKRMKAVLKRVAEKGVDYKPRDGYHFVDLSLYTDSLFGKEKGLIDLTIGDLLRN
ncbi:pfs domain-containing protein [Biscogniauxia mediterranea]|nr:pfs domain-containing protein [Biscogniauxia mediterranea]